MSTVPVPGGETDHEKWIINSTQYDSQALTNAVIWHGINRSRMDIESTTKTWDFLAKHLSLFLIPADEPWPRRSPLTAALTPLLPMDPIMENSLGWKSAPDGLTKEELELVASILKSHGFAANLGMMPDASHQGPTQEVWKTFPSVLSKEQEWKQETPRIAWLCLPREPKPFLEDEAVSSASHRQQQCASSWGRPWDR